VPVADGLADGLAEAAGLEEADGLGEALADGLAEGLGLAVPAAWATPAVARRRRPDVRPTTATCTGRRVVAAVIENLRREVRDARPGPARAPEESGTH
jgi:hypothetical protein